MYMGFVLAEASERFTIFKNKQLFFKFNKNTWEKLKKFEEVTGHQSDTGYGSGKCCGMCISCHVYKQCHYNVVQTGQTQTESRAPGHPVLDDMGEKVRMNCNIYYYSFLSAAVIKYPDKKISRR